MRNCHRRWKIAMREKKRRETENLEEFKVKLDEAYRLALVRPAIKYTQIAFGLLAAGVVAYFLFRNL